MPHWHELRNLVFTVAVALTSGVLLKTLGAPAPYLLGSLFGVWLLGGLVKPARALLDIPRWLHISVTLGMGVLVGAMFDPDIVHKISRWSLTVAGMLGATLLATAVGFIYLHRIRRYPRLLSLLCCMPGGQAEILAISRDLVEKNYVVALCHLVRVATVFCATPLLLALVQGQAAVEVSNRILGELPGLMTLSVPVIVVFVAVAIVGYLGGKLIRLPMAHLLGPLVLSAVLHVMGILDLPRIQEFVLLAQVTIGGAVGARLARVDVRELLVYLADALVNAVLLIGIYAVLAFALTSTLGEPYLNILLAFIPGGFYEVTLLALLFGFDVAMVTFHHTVRVLLVFFGLPFAVRSDKPGRKET